MAAAVSIRASHYTVATPVWTTLSRRKRFFGGWKRVRRLRRRTYIVKSNALRFREILDNNIIFPTLAELPPPISLRLRNVKRCRSLWRVRSQYYYNIFLISEYYNIILLLSRTISLCASRSLSLSSSLRSRTHLKSRREVILLIYFIDTLLTRTVNIISIDSLKLYRRYAPQCI